MPGGDDERLAGSVSILCIRTHPLRNMFATASVFPSLPCIVIRRGSAACCARAASSLSTRSPSRLFASFVVALVNVSWLEKCPRTSCSHDWPFLNLMTCLSVLMSVRLLTLWSDGRGARCGVAKSLLEFCALDEQVLGALAVVVKWWRGL